MHPAPMRGAFRDRHDPRGGTRWTRQRSVRAPGGRVVPSRRGVRELPASRRRRRCAVRTGAWMRPVGIALRAGPSRVVPMPVAGIKAMHRRPLRPEPTTPASADGDEPKRMNRRRGEHEASRKPTARGTPDVSGATVVTNSCAFYTCTRGCGRIARPAFRAPSSQERAKRSSQNSGAARREIAMPRPYRGANLRLDARCGHACVLLSRDAGKFLKAIVRWLHSNKKAFKGENTK